ncbi:unnamed protein product [Cylindrotheca closterium]|uniref:Leucine-rich repeat-containing N-terminal plant-type domain-containing protein n=1 Tax=Cylindrotheca closterium TaxID=2856 RepID=A0AAD2G7U8_9STRA|nr:unnamed protein product [Cylindrotheca closterium]
MYLSRHSILFDPKWQHQPKRNKFQQKEKHINPRSELSGMANLSCPHNHSRNDPLDIEQQSSGKPYPLARVDSTGLPIPPPPAESPPITTSKGFTPDCNRNTCTSNAQARVEKSPKTESTTSREKNDNVWNSDPKGRWSLERKLEMFILSMMILIVIVISLIVFFIFGPSSEGNGGGPVEIPATPLIEAPTSFATDPTLSPSEFGATPIPSPTTPPSLSPTSPPSLTPTWPPSLTPTSPFPSSFPSSPPTTVNPTLSPTGFERGIREFLSQQDGNANQDSEKAKKAIDWLLEEATVAQSAISPFNQKFLQRYGILILYFSVFSDQNTESGSPNNNVPLPNMGMQNQDECTWTGVTCDENGMMTAIKLSKRQLDGTLPSEWRHFPSLKSIDFSDNNLQGSIPEEVYEIIGLEEVYLYKNKLSGSISSKIGNLWNLSRFQASHNKLSGSIPPEFSSIGGKIRQIRYFDVHRNQMTGTIPSNMRLRQMFYMDLGRNQFSGTLPPDLGSEGYVRLRHLYLDHNYFEGLLPESYIVAGDGRINTLFVNDNNLTGAFPGNGEVNHRMNQLTIQNNNFTSMGPNSCRLYWTGWLVEFKANCNICRCRYMCRHCV